jgi:dihydrodipicolinate synthase/N-acetylneuraminate lyase
VSHGAVEIIADLVRKEREAKSAIQERIIELARAREHHAVVREQLEAVMALAGRQRMPSARPRTDKGKARK